MSYRDYWNWKIPDVFDEHLKIYGDYVRRTPLFFGGFDGFLSRFAMRKKFPHFLSNVGGSSWIGESGIELSLESRHSSLFLNHLRLSLLLKGALRGFQDKIPPLRAAIFDYGATKL